MFDLTDCALSDLTDTLTNLRKLRVGAENMEDAANRLEIGRASCRERV